MASNISLFDTDVNQIELFNIMSKDKCKKSSIAKIKASNSKIKFFDS